MSREIYITILLTVCVGLAPIVCVGLAPIMLPRAPRWHAVGQRAVWHGSMFATQQEVWLPLGESCGLGILARGYTPLTYIYKGGVLVHLTLSVIMCYTRARG